MKDYQKPYAKNLGELIPAEGRCWNGQSASSGSGGHVKMETARRQVLGIAKSGIMPVVLLVK